MDSSLDVSLVSGDGAGLGYVAVHYGVPLVHLAGLQYRGRHPSLRFFIALKALRFSLRFSVVLEVLRFPLGFFVCLEVLSLRFTVSLEVLLFSFGFSVSLEVLSLRFSVSLEVLLFPLRLPEGLVCVWFSLRLIVLESPSLHLDRLGWPQLSVLSEWLSSPLLTLAWPRPRPCRPRDPPELPGRPPLPPHPHQSGLLSPPPEVARLDRRSGREACTDQ